MMKKHLLLLLLLTAALLNSHRSIAQPYQSIFGKDSTMWNVVYSVANGIGMNTLSSKQTITISGENYHLVIPSWSCDSLLIWEDTNSGKVWCNNLRLDSSDYLMADMGLQLGDSFSFEFGQMKFAVDSVFYQNSKKLIRFNSASAFVDTIYFIEGVGPNVLFA